MSAVITSIEIVPKYLFSDIYSSTLNWNYDNITTKNFEYQIPYYFKSKSTNNNYTPKNGIMYTSPFCVLDYSDYTNNQQKYFPEFINNSSNVSSRTALNLQTKSFLGQRPTTLIYPTNYNVGTLNNVNYVSIFDVAYELPWTESYYDRWYAQNYQRIDSMRNVNALNNLVGYSNAFVNNLGSAGKNIVNSMLAKGQGAGNVITDATNLITDVTSQVASQYANEQAILQEISVAQNTIPTVKGNPSQINSLVTIGYYGIIFSYNTISAEECKIMDEFYSLYGYKLNVVKTPVLYDNTQLQKRKCWNYFKTSQCRLTRTENGANLNAGDEEMLQQIFDRGITFWSYADDVVIGDYSQDNPVVQK